MTADAAPARRTPRWWDLGVVGGAVVTALSVQLSGGGTSALRATAALAVLVVCWAAFGRRALDGRPGWQAFAAVTVAACLAGSLAHPAFAVVQCLAFPLVWTLAPGFRSAVVLNVLVALAVGTGYAVSSGSPAAAAGVEALSLGFSLALGTWISQIEQRSAERRTLIDELTAAQQRVAALGREAGAGVERERLARELHDTLAQSLTAIVMLAERSKARHPGDDALVVLEETARGALAESRALVAATAGVPLAGGLAAAVADLAGRFERETGMRVDVRVAADVPRPLEVVLLRCAQEGLANVRKHSGAAAVTVRVERVGDDVRLAIRDDGRGIGPGAIGGFGLAGMRERAALVGGEVAVRALDPHGTELTVSLPEGRS